MKFKQPRTRVGKKTHPFLSKKQQVPDVLWANCFER
jgi:hypothetical protein